jgi:hypothetical protein
MDPKLPIRSIDYTVIFARQMPKMREFYGSTMGFPLHRELSAKWVEYRVGSNIVALAEPGTRFKDPYRRLGSCQRNLPSGSRRRKSTNVPQHWQSAACQCGESVEI